MPSYNDKGDPFKLPFRKKDPTSDTGLVAERPSAARAFMDNQIQGRSLRYAKAHPKEEPGPSRLGKSHRTLSEPPRKKKKGKSKSKK